MAYIWVQSERRGELEKLGPPLQNFVGPLSRNYKDISGIFSLSPVDWHPFCASWVKGGVCVYAYKSEPHANGCGLRGV